MITKNWGQNSKYISLKPCMDTCSTIHHPWYTYMASINNWYSISSSLITIGITYNECNNLIWSSPLNTCHHIHLHLQFSFDKHQHPIILPKSTSCLSHRNLHQHLINISRYKVSRLIKYYNHFIFHIYESSNTVAEITNLYYKNH